MRCIICDKENQSKSIEHIVPESLGNKDYVMRKGDVCDTCNNSFADFEKKALANSVLVMERARFGTPSKKGKTAKGKITNLEIEGNKEFKKNLIYVKGLNSDKFKDFNPTTKIGKLYVPATDKSASATSKFLLKMGIESIYKSQKEIFNKYDFSELKKFLKGEGNTDWPFVIDDFEIGKFNSIPRYTDKFKLKNNNCFLTINETSSETVLFKFKYGVIHMLINLIGKNIEWIESMHKVKKDIDIQPDHIRNKILKFKSSVNH